MPRRSVLFAPGDEAAKLRTAATGEADVAVFDLEDGVRPADKPAARETVAATLADLGETDTEVCVRVNPVGEGAREDLAAVADAPAPDSVALPKADGAGAIEELGALLDEYGLGGPVLALVESARGVLRAEAVADADRTGALMFGAEDLAGDVGATRSDEGWEVAHARQQVLLAARAAGVDAVDTLYTDYGDREGLLADAERALALGYDGKLAIHPSQVPVINEAFTPDPDRVAWARRVLAAREEAEGGVFVVDGEMVDAPAVRQARRVLERAGEESDG